MHSVDELYTVSRTINSTNRAGQGPINLVASIESARALWNVGHIANWSSGSPGVKLTALLVGTYCVALFEDDQAIYLPRSLLQKIVSISLSTTCYSETEHRRDCADTSIIRTPSRQELLYTRSQIVVAAKAFGLEAIDMVRPSSKCQITLNQLSHCQQVCVNYKDPAYLKDECEDGRRLGFNGKVSVLLVTMCTLLYASFLQL